MAPPSVVTGGESSWLLVLGEQIDEEAVDGLWLSIHV